jgi:phospholipid/cholesterol/gamma-HCH transport system substrate-binding protein
MSVFGRRSAAPPHSTAPVPDERIWGRNYRGPRPWLVGIVLVAILTFASLLAFTKHVPFTSPGYELHATFQNAATLRTDSPVRIAGVNVGKVTSVQAKGDAAEVTFTVSDAGQPVHDDATAEIRPRLFLEGNFFVDLRPGSPSAPELASGGDIPVAQTSTAVQLDEVLTSLQSGSRRDLQRALAGFGTGLNYQPTAADDATQDPAVQGETGGQALNETFKYGGRAGKGTAQVNQAFLGESPHDLSGLIRASRDFFRKLADRETQLQGLITNFNTTSGALASESANLSASLRELAPTLEEAQPSLLHLNQALPPLRAWARALEPNIRELPATIRAGNPWLEQTRVLLQDKQLGGLARLLAKTAPGLAKTTHASLRLFPQLTDLSRCTAGVLEPTGNIVVNDDFSTGQPNFREFFYSTVNFAGESQNFDGNGQYVRFQSGGGPQLLQAPNPAGQPQNRKVFGNNIETPTGIQPALPASQPPFRMDVPCAQNPIPDVNGTKGAVAPSDLTAAP